MNVGPISRNSCTHPTNKKNTLTQIPSPGRLRAAHQALVPDRMQGRLSGRDPDDGVRPPLPRRPAHFPGVQSLRETDLSPYAVGALGDRVPVEGELVVLLDEYVQRTVLRVPAVLQLGLAEGGRHVQQHVQPRGPGKVLGNR